MIFRACRKLPIPLFSLLVLLAACDSATDIGSTATEAGGSDNQLQSQVESALANASDLPPGLTVEVNQGVVTISGSLECEGCGGLRTPGNIGTVQQSLGAIVRAVPGVTQVEFNLTAGL